MRFKKFTAVLFAGTLTAVPVLGNAQEIREQARAETRGDDRRDFGWLGLLGLGGLFGLMRREREHDAIRDRDRVATHAR